MNLTKKLNLDMEIAYVPVAKLKDVQQMMSDWKDNNRKIKIYSVLTCVTAVVSAIYFMYEKDNTPNLISLLSAVIFLLGGLLASQSKKIFYYFPVLALAVFSLVPAYYHDTVIKNFFMITVFLPAIISSWYAYKAIYNYKNVYIALTKREGFPHFVFSTVDMYGKKMYIKDKDKKTVAEKRVEASYNPFNENGEIREEEIRRMNTLRYDEVKKLEQEIFKDTYYEAKEVKHSAEKTDYKYGKSIFGFDIIFPHNEIPGSNKEEKRRLMRLWNELKGNMFKNEISMITFLLMNLTFGVYAGIGLYGIFLFIPLILYIFATNLIKDDKWIGVPITTICVACFSTVCVHYITTAIYIVTVMYYMFFVLPRFIVWWCNLPIYKKLSKEQGFPTFYESKSEMYGDQMYIVEKQEPIKKRSEKIQPIVMNIGYDEDDENKRINNFDYAGKNKDNIPEKENKAWNAFNYLETDTENSAYDEFAIYEEINRKRREAELREDVQKPNKDMGRKKQDED